MDKSHSVPSVRTSYPPLPKPLQPGFWHPFPQLHISIQPLHVYYMLSLGSHAFSGFSPHPSSSLPPSLSAPWPISVCRLLSVWTLPDASGYVLPHIYKKNLLLRHTWEWSCPPFHSPSSTIVKLIKCVTSSSSSCQLLDNMYV